MDLDAVAEIVAVDGIDHTARPGEPQGMSSSAVRGSSVVLFPGITGSALAVDHDRNEVWGLSGRAIMNGVLSFKRVGYDLCRSPRNRWGKPHE